MPNQWHQLCCLICVLVCGAIFEVQSESKSWGHVGRYATPIYDVEVKHNTSVTENVTEVAWMDLTYPETNDPSNYTIIAMHAFDEIGDDHGSQALLMAGGVNNNYVTIRFISCLGCGLHFRLTIYGLHL